MKLLWIFTLGLLLGGMYVQYRITGDLWHNDTTKSAYTRGYMDGLSDGFLKH